MQSATLLRGDLLGNYNAAELCPYGSADVARGVHVTSPIIKQCCVPYWFVLAVVACRCGS